MRSRVPGCAAPDFGIMVTLIDIVFLALGGNRARKLRAVLPDLALKGEKAVVTEVMNRVIMLANGQCVNRRS